MKALCAKRLYLRLDHVVRNHPFIMLILAENSASQCNTLICWHLKQDNWRTNWQKGKDPREQKEIRQTASRQLSGKSVLILLVQHPAGGSALENGK